MPREPFRDTIAYWERRRVWYNLALTVLAVGWVIATWPHFRPALTWQHAIHALGLAVIANLLYSIVYLVDLPMQESSLASEWRRNRWILWLAGTLLALGITYYWIADEIYPDVGTADVPGSMPVHDTAPR